MDERLVLDDATDPTTHARRWREGVSRIFAGVKARPRAAGPMRIEAVTLSAGRIARIAGGPQRVLRASDAADGTGRFYNVLRRFGCSPRAWRAAG